jgi:mono/diheme cytochrome c family protein
MLRTVVPFAVILLTQFAAQAIAHVPSGNATAGQKLVRAQCSTCHDGEGSPRARQQGASLAAVAAMPSTTSLSLRAFPLTPHAKMPNCLLTPQEIHDVVAYIHPESAAARRKDAICRKCTAPAKHDPPPMHDRGPPRPPDRTDHAARGSAARC